MFHRAVSITLTGFFVFAVAETTACHDLEVHTFVGQHFDKTNDCLQAKGLVDVIDGQAHGTCNGVRCFVQVTNGADGDAWVSTACEAPPGFRDATEDKDGSVCADALSAYSKGADGACKTNV